MKINYDMESLFTRVELKPVLNTVEIEFVPIESYYQMLTQFQPLRVDERVVFDGD